MREELSALMHEIWGGWMKYLFSRCDPEWDTMIIPSWAVRRWKQQMDTPYDDLSEREKDSDRREADKVLELFARRLLLANTVVERNPVSEMVERVAEARYAMVGGNPELVPVAVIERWLAYIEDGEDGVDCEELT